MPGFPCCCDCRCRCASCTSKAPARYKLVISGLTAATSADVNTTVSTDCTTDIHGNFQADPTYESDAANLDPCSTCGDLDGTYILYNGGTASPKCDPHPSGSGHLCYWEPLTLPSDCDVDYMRLSISDFYHAPTETAQINYFTLKIGFEDYCSSGGSTDPDDCTTGGELDEVFYSAELWWEGWLGDYSGVTCCNAVDFALDDFNQSMPGSTYYDAGGDCLAVDGPTLGYHRRCSSGGAGTIKITALED